MVLLALTRETPSFVVPSFWCLTANDDSRRTERRERGEETKPPIREYPGSSRQTSSSHLEETITSPVLEEGTTRATLQPGNTTTITHTHSPTKKQHQHSRDTEEGRGGGKRNEQASETPLSLDPIYRLLHSRVSAPPHTPTQIRLLGLYTVRPFCSSFRV